MIGKIFQFRGERYELRVVWWFPVIKKWVHVGPAIGDEPHEFPYTGPSHVARGFAYVVVLCVLVAGAVLILKRM